MPTYVSKIHLPDKQKLVRYIERIYESGWLTNGGPLVQELEERLCDFLGVRNLLAVCNGTAALQIAYMVLELKGEVVTTPFSFVSTTSSIAERGLVPVFADIDPRTLNLDPKQTAIRITTATSAIVPVHVFGNACDIDEIDRIASVHGLKVVYDASHAFAVNYKGRSIFEYGDISTVSFHATKFFHTIEGGAVVVKDDDLFEQAKIIRNYGQDGPDSIARLGINGKMNEFQAAMGLCVLDDIDIIMEQRQEAYQYYVDTLKDAVDLQQLNEDATSNFSYFPVILESNTHLNEVRNALNALDIYPRQYFSPSLDTVSYVQGRRPMCISRDIASRILVLPLHSGAEKTVADVVLETIKRAA